jgi:hypothetical protein
MNMKIAKGVTLKRNANTVSLTVVLNSPNGEFITKWLDENGMLSDPVRHLVLNNLCNASEYTIAVRGTDCKFGKRLFTRMQDQIQEAFKSKQSMVAKNVKV